MFKKYITSIGITCSLLMLCSANLSQTPAQSPPEDTEQNEQTTPIDTSNQTSDPDDDSFFNPPPLGSPQRTADGGARGDCPVYSDRDRGLTLLIPDNDPVTIAAATISEHPTFLLYLPEYSGIKGLVLRILDDRDEDIYTKIIPVSSESGIIRFTLPESQFNGLTSGQWYILYLFVSKFDTDIDRIKDNNQQCDMVQGLIGRRPLDRTQRSELNAAKSLEDLWSFYAQEIIWYDALATLDEMRRQNPGDQRIQRRWQGFLGLIGLEHLAEYPPVDIPENIQ